MAWERLPAKASIRTNVPAIGVQKNGRVSWNQGTQEALGNPEFVELLLDKQTKRLGLRRAEQSEETFIVRRAGKQRTWGISAEGALKSVNIRAENAYRRYAEVKDDIVFIDIAEISSGK